MYYRPFHKTLPRSSAFINWISVSFYETDCIQSMNCALQGHHRLHVEVGGLGSYQGYDRLVSNSNFRLSYLFYHVSYFFKESQLLTSQWEPTWALEEQIGTERVLGGRQVHNDNLHFIKIFCVLQTALYSLKKTGI